MAHFDIFREELAIKYPAYGHALWEPSPGKLYDAIEVGDVGYIREGKFHRLFNALLPGDHDSHRNFGVPEYHEPLKPKMSKHIDSGTLNPNDLCSGAVTATSGGLDVLATGPVGAAQVSFSCSRRQGAILSLPVQAQRQDTVARGEFGRWIVKHINLWFAFTQELGLGLNRMEDIILVTGFHRARSWANIAFSEGSGGARVSFGVRVSGTSGANVEWKYSREDIQGVVLNLGPSGQNLPEDQCIFVRGFRVTRFIRILPRLRGAAGPAPLPDGHEPEPDAQLVSVPAGTNYQDPLRTLLEYIAEQAPGCDMALVHDDDLDYIGSTSLEGNQPDEIRGYLQNLAPKLQELRFDTFPVHKSSEGAQMATATVAMLSSHASDLPADNPSLESHNTLKSDGQHSVGLASSPQPTESSPQPLAKLSPELCALFNASLDEYTQQTGILLASHPLTANLENSNSPEAFIAVIDQTRAFHDFRRGDWRMLLMRLLKPLMNVLLALSTTAALGDDLRLVLSPSKAIFGAIGIFLSGVSARSNAFVELFETLGSFLDLLRVYTVIQPTPEMTTIILKTMAELIIILAIATKQIKQSRFKSYGKTVLEDSSVADVLHRLDRLTREEVQKTGTQILKVVYGLLSNMRLVMDGEASNMSMDSIQEALDVINKTAIDLRRTGDRVQPGLREWLSPPDPSTIHNVALCAHHPETSAWFIQGTDFENWKGSGSLMWIHGKPGCGKSVLCSVIIEDLMRLRMIELASVAYFYFDYQNDEMRSIRGLISSLLVQLSAQSESYHDILVHMYSKYEDDERHPSDSDLAECLMDMLTLQKQGATYIIIDGLDECPAFGLPSPRENVLGLLTDLVGLQQPNLHICVMSRPEADISAVLRPIASRHISLHEESRQAEDIAKYIRSVINSDPGMKDWKVKEKRMAIDTLTEKADGMFRWVSCQLDVLRHCLQENIQSTLQKLPGSVDKTYERILEGIQEMDWKDAHRLFQCLVVSARPLRVKELAEILVFDFDAGDIPTFDETWRAKHSKEALLSICSSLIDITGTHPFELVQFSHSSVREFLTSDRLAAFKTGVSRYHIRLGPAHTFLAQTCLGVLLQSDDRTIVNNSPLSQYAARHWVFHARFEGESPLIRRATERLFDPQKAYFSTWVGIHDEDDQMFSIVPDDLKKPTARPLYYAARCGFPYLTEHLAIAWPQDVNAPGGQLGTALQAASAGGHLGIVELLLKHGANVNAKGGHYGNALQAAAAEGFLEVAQTLIEHQADVDAEGGHHGTSLSAAAAKGHTDIVRLLLQHSANPNAHGGSDLMSAAAKGHLEIVRLLLSYGADPNTKGGPDGSALHAAAVNGHLEVVKLLLEKGANVNAQHGSNGSALRVAAANGHHEIVQLLLEHEMDSDSDSGIALWIAVANGHREIVRLLLEHGVDPNTQSRFALQVASRGGDLEMIRLLLEHGANPNVQGGIILWTAAANGYLEIAKLLLDHGAKIDAYVDFRGTSLHAAAKNERLDMVRLLFKHGADPNAQGGPDGSTLRAAVTTGQVGLVQLLLEHGVFPGRVALQVAARNGNLEMVRLLLEHGSNPNASGGIVLQEAAENGHVEVVRLLLGYGADPNIQDGHSLQSAAKGGHLEVVRLLLRRGTGRNAQVGKSLQSAAKNGHIETVRLLLEHGADPNYQGDPHGSVLRAAAMSGRLDTVELLLERGADPNSYGDRYDSPRQEASNRGHDDIVQLLLKRGAR